MVRFEDMVPFNIKVDFLLTVKDLKKLLADRLGQEWTNLRIFHQYVVLSELLEDAELKEPNKELYNYRMKDGDGIVVIRKCP